MTDTVKILKDAKQLLINQGWAQRAYVSCSGFCAVGAVARVAHASLHRIGRPDEPATSAVDALARVMETPDAKYGFGRNSEGRVFDFNDSEARTVEEVLAKFDEAIAAEEAKAEDGGSAFVPAKVAA